MSTLDQSQVAGSTLGYAQITSNFVTSASSSTQVTGLTATVTIPSGGRRVKITGYIPSVTNTTATIPLLEIWDGTVGSGAKLNEFRAKPADQQGMIVMAIVTPAAGSKTYNIGCYTTAGTITLQGSTTTPAFILVELI